MVLKTKTVKKIRQGTKKIIFVFFLLPQLDREHKFFKNLFCLGTVINHVIPNSESLIIVNGSNSFPT